MPYTPTVQDRSGEILAQGITQGFSSLVQGVKDYELKKEEVKKTAGEMKAFGQTLEGLIKLKSLPESARIDYQNVLGADVKTQQGYLNAAVKNLNLTLEAGRDAQARAQSEAAIAVNKAQLDEINQRNANNKAFTQAMSGMPNTVIGTDQRSVQAAPQTPTANLNDFLYRGGKEVSVAPPFESGMSPLMGRGLTQARTNQPRSFDSSFGNTVPVIPPNELKDLVYPDTEKRKFGALNDVANSLRNDQKNMISGTKKQISEFEDLLNKGRQDVSMQVLDTGVAMPMPNIGRTPLTDTERSKALPQLTNAKAKLALQEQGLFALEKRITAAERFAGTPITQKAIDPAVDPVIKILSLPNIIKRELKNIEVKTERPLTSDEKLSFVTKDFIKRGGVLTPKLLSELKDSTKSNIEVFYVDGITVLKVGDGQAQYFDRDKPISAALSKMQDQQNYQKALTLAANVGINKLPPADRNTLAELHGAFGRTSKDISGIESRDTLEQAVAVRARDMGLGAQASAQVYTIPKTGVPSSLSKYKVELEK